MGQYCFHAVVCRRRLSSVTLPTCGPAGDRARGRSGGRQLHGGPVRLRPVRATPSSIKWMVTHCVFIQYFRPRHYSSLMSSRSTWLLDNTISFFLLIVFCSDFIFAYVCISVLHRIHIDNSSMLNISAKTTAV